MNWALIGVGNIAELFMQSLIWVEEVNVVAAYGRNKERLHRFCDRWGIQNRYTDYTALYEQNDIEVVYLATPHIVHYRHAVSALEHGKHVLCEKPMAMSREETRMLSEAARQNDVFLMEAMWTRFFPANIWLQKFTESGRFGRPLNVNAEFSFAYPYDPDYRFFRKDLGGGCMRSAGIYPLAYASMIFGCVPCRISAFGEMRNGVDVRTTAILQFPGEHGRTAQLYTGFQGQSQCMANIAFEKGNVLIPDFIHPSRVIVTDLDGHREEMLFPYEGPGLHYEIRHAMECIRAGHKESEIMPLEESIEIAGITDLIYQELEKAKGNEVN